MTLDHRITRTVKMSGAALRRGAIDLPDGVTFFFAGVVPIGEFPHVPMDGDEDPCPAVLLVKITGGHEYEPWCTRKAGHDLHVAHLQPGQPVAAWTNEGDRPTELAMYVIYEATTDFPDQFVVRKWTITAAGPVATSVIKTGATLDAVRAMVPAGLVRLGRADADEPQIVESWV